MPDVTIIGGFERSGHDAASAALAEACRAAGLRAQAFNWRDHLDLDDLMVFHLHRLGVRLDLDGLTAIAESPSVKQALVDDLAPVLRRELREGAVVISVHPWSSLVVDVKLGGHFERFVDCHVEFSAFPVRPLSHATWQTGTWAPRPAIAAHRARYRQLGIPVRRAFAPGMKDAATIAVNCGSDGWFADRALAALPSVIDAVGEAEVVLLAGDGLLTSQRKVARLRAPVRVVQGSSDVSAEIAAARYLVTKAGGAPVAEALACETVPILLASGVPWEDEALARLVSHGAAVNAHSPTLHLDISSSGLRSQRRSELGQLCRAAAERIVRLACSNEAPEQPAGEGCKMQGLLDRASREMRESPLPQTSRALASEFRAELP